MTQPYEITTEDGTVLAVDHEYNGNVYTQRELLVPQMLKLGKLLSSLNLPGLLDFSDMPTIKVGDLITAIFNNNAHAAFLSIILTTKDGQPVPEERFHRGKAMHLISFMEDVFAGFFSLNTELTERLMELFVRALANGVTKAAGLAERLTSYISSVTATSPDSKPSKKRRTDR